MIQELLTIEPADTFQDICNRMGDFLALATGIPENAMRRAIEDPDYANNLITCRDAPDFLSILLMDPRNQRYALKLTDDNEFTNTELITSEGHYAIDRNLSLYQYSNFMDYSRFGSLNFSYRFGSRKTSKVRIESGSSDEQKRAGN